MNVLQNHFTCSKHYYLLTVIVLAYGNRESAGSQCVSSWDFVETKTIIIPELLICALLLLCVQTTAAGVTCVWVWVSSMWVGNDKDNVTITKCWSEWSNLGCTMYILHLLWAQRKCQHPSDVLHLVGYMSLCSSLSICDESQSKRFSKWENEWNWKYDWKRKQSMDIRCTPNWYREHENGVSEIESFGWPHILSSKRN